MVISGKQHLAELDQYCYEYMKAGRRPNTRRNTKSQASSYQRFCDEYNLVELPADEWQLSRYAVYTANRVSAHGTVDNYVGNVKTLQQLAGYGTIPTSPTFKMVMDGVKSKLAKEVKKASSLNITILAEIAEFVKFDNEYEHCAYVTILSGFYLTVRSSNLVPISTEKFNPKEQLTRWHVGFDEDLKVVTFCIEWSKNNQNKGKEVWIPISRSDQEKTCLVRSLHRYFKAVPLLSGDPCFSYHNSRGEVKALSYSQLNEQLKYWVSLTGRDGSTYTTHAMRRGGINHGIRAGLSPSFLRVMGDWATDCFMKYVDFDLDVRSAATVRFNKHK